MDGLAGLSLRRVYTWAVVCRPCPNLGTVGGSLEHETPIYCGPRFGPRLAEMARHEASSPSRWRIAPRSRLGRVWRQEYVGRSALVEPVLVDGWKRRQACERQRRQQRRERSDGLSAGRAATELRLHRRRRLERRRQWNVHVRVDRLVRVQGRQQGARDPMHVHRAKRRAVGTRLLQLQRAHVSVRLHERMHDRRSRIRQMQPPASSARSAFERRRVVRQHEQQQRRRQLFLEQLGQLRVLSLARRLRVSALAA